MRRSIAAAAAALATALSVLPATSSSAADGLVPHPDQLTRVQAEQALERAHDVLDGASTAAGGVLDPTLALRDLFVALPALTPEDQVEARSVLARPGGGNRKCSKHVCLHWRSPGSGADAPPSTDWAQTNLRVMSKVWKLEVGKMNYRRPVKDGAHGGNGKLDVYLAELGSQGYYGYCAPEYYKPGRKREASGYCVLDQDFAESQYGAPPMDSLRVTAAHEFFHAVQFAYDFKEDHWLMEASSTWMEERFADGVNDNLQYLPAGQVSKPGVPLDTFNPNGVEQYGNWVWFEFLSSRFGNGVVRSIWNQAGAFPGSGKKYSTQAVTSVLRHHGSFRSVFARYAAGNITPGKTYAEGAAWPSAAVARSWTLSQDKRHASAGFKVDHMSSRNVALKPDASLAGKRWHARIKVDGPGRASSPAAQVVVHRADGKAITKSVHLDRKGRGSVKVPFSHGRIGRVTVTLANASTRFACHQGTNFSCRGKSRDNNRKFQVGVSAVKG